jgi:hypothetical protein
MWAPAADQQALVRQGEEVRFAADSPVEEGGFEPSVPLGTGARLRRRLIAYTVDDRMVFIVPAWRASCALPFLR